MSTTTTENLRTADLKALVDLLNSQQARKVDAVVPASQLRATDGQIVVSGMGAELNEDGVTTVDGRYRPTEVAIEHLADKLAIPLAYLRRIHDARPDLFDANVNGWLLGQIDPEGDFAKADPDGRAFLARMLRPADGEGPGILRALLSDRFGIIDHLDVLLSALEGIRDSGAEVNIQACDLTDRKMYVRIHAPSVAVHAERLLDGYRSPFSGNTGTDNPTVFAGVVLANSETGGGSWTIAPQIVVQVCTNGMTIKKDVFKRVHLGGRMDHGIVKFAADTQAAQLEVIKKQCRDTFRTILDVEYVAAKVAELEEAAGITVAKPQETIELVAQRLSYSDGQREDILRMFIEGGQSTAGGVMQAVTAAAQLQPDGDAQYAMEMDAGQALMIAAGASR